MESYDSSYLETVHDSIITTIKNEKNLMVYCIHGNNDGVFYLAVWRFWVETVKLKFANECACTI